MYGGLAKLLTEKVYNFKWVGIVATVEKLTAQEEKDIEEQLNAKQSYPLFMTFDELEKYLLFYENVLKPILHNFKMLFETTSYIESPEYWKAFQDVSLKFA